MVHLKKTLPGPSKRCIAIYLVTWANDAGKATDELTQRAHNLRFKPRKPLLRRTLLRPPRDRLACEDHKVDQGRGDLARLLALRVTLGGIELVEEPLVRNELLELAKGKCIGFDAHPHRTVHCVAQNDIGQVEEQRHVVCEAIVKV